MRPLLIIFLFVTLLGVADAAIARKGAVRPGCAMPNGWAEIAKANPRFIIFGEIHGTREAPAFVGDVACALAARGERILVAVEHGSQHNDAFQTAWRLPDSAFRSAIVKAGWAGRSDGVASEAMRDLLVRLHRLKTAGRAIRIVAFNGARDDAQRARFRDLPGQGPHEAAQAENIRAAADAEPFDRVLVLVGNIHARKRPVDNSGVTFKPMAMHLAPFATILSLNMIDAGGTVWNCRAKPGVVFEAGKPIPDGAIECASHAERGQADLNVPRFVAMGPFPGEAGNGDYDGYVWLGRVTGSPPAVPAARETKK